MEEHWKCPVSCPGCGTPAPYGREEWRRVDAGGETTALTDCTDKER